MTGTTREAADMMQNPAGLAAEYVAICRELGCIVRPGLALDFTKKLRTRLGEAHAREGDLIRMWDPATPTERQELDRMRRGWGPSSPTERERRRQNVAACVQALSIAMSEVTVAEDEEVEEEVQERLDTAYDRLSKAHDTVLAVLREITTDPAEWPDIRAAEERGRMSVAPLNLSTAVEG